MPNKILAVAAFISIFILSCNKNIEDEFQKKDGRSVALNASAPTFSYGAALFFLKPTQPNYSILPKVKPAVPGIFRAIPLGLSLDSVTGRINIRKSLSGLRYKVYYVSPVGNKLLDSTNLVISGIDYADSIYVLRATPGAYDTAFPIYNANRNLELPCDLGDDDNENLCVFDETDLNNDGNDDISGINQQKLLVDEKGGSIDIEASYHAGIFGSLNPPNGTNKDFTFYYRLNDKSNLALNTITVRIYYFRKKSDIPKWLLKQLKERKAIDERVNMKPLPGLVSIDADRTFVTMDFTSYLKPRRPPIIAIIGQ